LLDQANRAEEGLISCSKAVELSPSNFAGFNNRGWVYWGLGRFSDAAKDFAKAAAGGEDNAIVNLLNVSPWVSSKGDLEYILKDLYKKGPPYQDAFVSLFAMFVESGNLSETALQLGQLAEKSMGPNSRLTMALALAGAQRGDAKLVEQQVTTLLAPLDARQKSLLNPLTSGRFSSIRKTNPSKKFGTYLSDSDRVACYMETLQRDELRSYWDADKLEKLRNAFQTDTLKEAFKRHLWTRYENPVAFAILEPVVKRVETAIQKSGRNIPALLYGTLDSTNVNAEATIVPQPFVCDDSSARTSKYDDRIVMVNWRTFDFAYLITKLLTKTIGFAPDGGVDVSTKSMYRAIRSYPQIVEEYTAFLSAFLMVANARPDIALDSRIAPVIGLTTDAAESFVVAHEYGHVLLGHDLARSEQRRDVAAALKEWKQELEADAFAVGIMPTVAAESPFKGSVSIEDRNAVYDLGPLLFLRELELMEEADRLLHGRQEEMTLADKERLIAYVSEQSESRNNSTVLGESLETRILATDHPPLWLRRTLLQRSLLSTIQKKNDDPRGQTGTAEIMLTLMDRVDVLFDGSKQKLAQGSSMLTVQTEIERQLASRN
jgi:hypothetical protein